MALATAVISVAGSTAAAMYIDAKYHIHNDLRAVRALKRAQSLYVDAVAKKRQSLYYLYEDSVKRRGDHDCIWSREGCFSWNEAYNRINQFGQWFLSQGVRPHDLVAMYMQNSPEFIFVWIGLLSIGAAPALLNYNLAGPALIHTIRISGVKIILVDQDPQLVARLENIAAAITTDLMAKVVVLDAQTKADIAATSYERPADSYREIASGNEPMGLFYTSGTTGMPKGCPISVGRTYMSVQTRIKGPSPPKENDRWYNCMPMYHGTGGIVAMTQMMSGTTLCVGKKFSTTMFWNDCRDSRATWIAYVGETARYLLSAPPSPRDKDHCVRGMQGNGLRSDVWVKFRERFGIHEIVEFFSSTEGMFNLLCRSRNDYLVGAVGHHGAITRFTTRNLYIPVQIDEETGKVARDPKTGFAYRQPFEKGGEILVAVPSEKAFSGYYHDANATAKKFERNVLKEGDIFYRTGDALKRDKDGRWYFLDRLGDTFRWKGENVSTAEVSEVMGKYQGVVEANVYGVLVPRHDGRAGCAAVYIHPDERHIFNFGGLLKHCLTYLPRYAIPRFLRIVENMTPIHNNKQNKVPLRDEGIDPEKIKPGDIIVWVSNDWGTYEPFTTDHWEDLHLGKVRL